MAQCNMYNSMISNDLYCATNKSNNCFDAKENVIEPVAQTYFRTSTSSVRTRIPQCLQHLFRSS